LHPLTVARAAIQQHNALQKEAELAGLLAVLLELEPKVIVEVGCDAGGTLWAWRQLEPQRLLGVELPRAGFHSGKPLQRHGAEVVIGNSHEQATYDQLVKLLDGDEVDFLFIDADHTYNGVKRDFELYSPLVRPGGVIALHDICNHPRMPEVQVGRFWLQVREGAETEEFITDPPTWGGIGALCYQPAEVPA
jgi:predicted O-methyltransferase YrrM